MLMGGSLYKTIVWQVPVSVVRQVKQFFRLTFYLITVHSRPGVPAGL
jgi:hypothetical protein